MKSFNLFYFLSLLTLGTYLNLGLSLPLRGEDISASDDSTVTEEYSLHGYVLFSLNTETPILVEARKAVPCPQGFCPIIGHPAMASILLKEVGPFSLYLKRISFPLMAIATYQSPEGSTRVAHQAIENNEEFNNILLSLDRPQKALR